MLWSIIGIAIGIWLFVKYVSPAIDRAFNNGPSPSAPPSLRSSTPPQFVPAAPRPPQPETPFTSEPATTTHDPLVPPIGWYDDPLSDDRLRYSDGVRWTEQTARKTANTVAAERQDDDEDTDDGADDHADAVTYSPSVTVAVQGCEEAIGPTCALTVSIEPGYVVVDSCRWNCSDASHALVLTAEEASDACERLWIAASHGATAPAGPQNSQLAVAWTSDEDAGTDSVSFDWTAKILDQEARAAWNDGRRPDDADCGTLNLTGKADTPGSPLDRFATILYESGKWAREWDAGRATEASISASMAKLGPLIHD